MVQNKKFYPLHPISEEPYIVWLSFMVHMCKMIISPGIFFNFFKILIFWGVVGVGWEGGVGVKVQKMVQNDKKFCRSSCSISQEPYIIWLSFMVHICKMIIPSVFFFFSFFFHFFKILAFWVYRQVKEQKMVQNEKKLCLLHSCLRNHTSYDCHLWCKLLGER